MLFKKKDNKKVNNVVIQRVEQELLQECEKNISKEQEVVEKMRMVMDYLKETLPNYLPLKSIYLREPIVIMKNPKDGEVDELNREDAVEMAQNFFGEKPTDDWDCRDFYYEMIMSGIKNGDSLTEMKDAMYLINDYCIVCEFSDGTFAELTYSNIYKGFFNHTDAEVNRKIVLGFVIEIQKVLSRMGINIEEKWYKKNDWLVCDVIDEITAGFGLYADWKSGRQSEEELDSRLDCFHDMEVYSFTKESLGDMYDETYSCLFVESSHAKMSVDEREAKSSIEELDSLIGLAEMKKTVKKLIAMIKFQEESKKRGVSVPTISQHMVFSGNPGTGKTTVARLVAAIFKEIGFLSKGHLVEADRSSLVAGYVGQTATKTMEILNNALGGVLFIDEAYTLSRGGDEFGQEAIDTILKFMEDHRDNLVVIVAGYSDLMDEFVESNPGLKSRFTQTIVFEDYNKDELISIFKMMVSKNNLIVSNEVMEIVENDIQYYIENKDEHFGNGRLIRQYVDRIYLNHTARFSTIDFGQIDTEEMLTITKEDLVEAR